MALKRIQEFSKNVAVHQQLGDNPNTDDNLSASELKATFDRPAEDIKEYVNGTLVPAIQELEEYGDSVSANLSDMGKEVIEIKRAVIGAQGSANQAAFNAARAAGMAEEAASASRDASAAASAAQTAAETASTDASMAASDAEAATQAASAAQAAAAGAVKFVNGVRPRGIGNVNLAVNALAECKTPPINAIKEVAEVDGFVLVVGAILGVKFLYSNTAANPQLSYGEAELPILDRLSGRPIEPSDITAGIYHLQLTGTGWILLDKQQISGSTTPVPGPPGEDGGHWIPHVGDNGTLTWTASKEGMGDAPTPVNIKGLPGADGDPGADGAPGADGQDGGYYIPKISQTGINTMQMGFDPSKPGMTSVQPRQIVLPKGDPGQDGVSPTISITTITGGHRLTITDAEGPKSADILDGATPALQIGTVTTLPAGSPATAEITGTAANPVLSFGLPRGADATGGSAGVTTINGLDGAVKLPVSGSCICNSNAADKRKVLTGVTAGFDPSADGAILAVQFKSPGNTASGLELQIGQTVYTILHPGNLTPPAASALKKSVHHFSMRGSTRAAILLDPYVAPSTVNVDATLTQIGQAADAKAVGDKIKEVRDNFTSGNEQLAGTDLTLQDPADADHGVALQLGAKIVDSSGFPTAQRLYPTGIYGDEPVIIGNLADPQDPRDAVSRQYLDDRLGALPASGTAVWRLLGEYDFANEQVGVIELTNLGGLTDIYFRWEGISNTSATKSGMIITVNSVVAALGEGDIIPIQSSSQSKLYGYTSAHWNGLSWDARTTGGATSPENYSANAYWRGQYNQKLNVGACNEIKISQPGLDYKATSGILRIYGGK